MKLPWDEVQALHELERRFVEHKRWTVLFEVVVELNGESYRYLDAIPATEAQEYEHPAIVDLEPVHKVWYRTYKWAPGHGW
jgi:hypothetical protein